MLVGLGISPFAQRCLDKALGLAIGLGHVRLGSDAFETEPATSTSKGVRFVAGAVVGHDALDRDSQAGIVGAGGLQEGDGTGSFLILQHLAESDPGRVADADTNELPAQALAFWRSGCSDRDDRP